MSMRALAFGVLAALCAAAIAFAPRIGALDPWREARNAERDALWPTLERATSALADERSQRDDKIRNLSVPARDGAGPLLRAQATAPADLSAEPILRIETEMHTAQIRSLDVDAKGEIAVTGSYDKTVRVWAIPKDPQSPFRLLRVLRPPIGDGNEGKVFAVAISPDARLVAVGGWMGWDGAASRVYLFDRASGRLISTIGGLPEVVQSLAWSPDGRRLAAGLGGAWGLRVFELVAPNEVDAAPRALAIAAETYGDSIYGLDFATDGRLAVASDDGKVRLYAADFASVMVSAHVFPTPFENSFERTSALAVAPDGRIAVGSADSTQLAILSDRALAVVARPRTSVSAAGAPFYGVTWSADGLKLYAAGRPAEWISKASGAKEDRTVIVRFDNRGLGPTTNILSGARDTIFGIASLVDGRLIYASAEPGLGRLDAADRPAGFDGPLLVGFAGSFASKTRNERGLRLSPDGRVASAPFEFRVGPVFLFNSARRRLIVAPEEQSDLKPPLLAAEGLRVEGWNTGRLPSVNGALLAIERNETSRALAVAPARDRFALATEWYVRLYDKTGKEIWAKPGPAVAWQVNISWDGKWVVAAFGDGTIRWYDIKDGAERLALFVTNEPEAPRWIAWTPAGYYDASPGAEDLIGWHINQGTDKEALFFSASRFRELYYRPDEIRRALDGKSKPLPPPSREAILKLAPPIVTVLGQRRDADGTVVVDYEARTIYGDPVDAAPDIFVNGAKVDGARTATAPKPNGARQVRLPKFCGEGALEVTDGRGGVSERAIFTGDPAESCAALTAPGVLHVLAIGVGAYQNTRNFPRLDFADDDARAVAEIFKKQEGRAFSSVKTTVLVDASAAAINTALTALKEEKGVGVNDLTVVFFSGHGFSVPPQDIYFAAADADANEIGATTATPDALIAAIRGRKGRKLVLVDACRSGLAAAAFTRFDNSGLFNKVSGQGEIEVLVSSQGDELSWESSKWGHGAFTRALIDGLSGAADDPRDTDTLGSITSDELYVYVRREVPRLVRAVKGDDFVQQPAVPRLGATWTIARVPLEAPDALAAARP